MKDLVPLFVTLTPHMTPILKSSPSLSLNGQFLAKRCADPRNYCFDIWISNRREPSRTLNLPLLDVPLSCSFMRPSIAVPRASFSQTASD